MESVSPLFLVVGYLQDSGLDIVIYYFNMVSDMVLYGKMKQEWGSAEAKFV